MRVLLEGARSGQLAAPLQAWTSDQGALLVPAGTGDLAGHYDLTISHPLPQGECFAAFDRWLAGAAASHGLSCALLHDAVVPEAIHRLDTGRLTIGYHLDYFSLWHRHDDPYARLAQAVQDAGGWPVNSPARSRAFTDKAAAHLELERKGLGVPATRVVRPWSAEPSLTDAERNRLGLDRPGTHVYVKPANGFGGRGVVRADANSLAAVLAEARRSDPHETFLVQREVRCPSLRGDDGVERAAYWRVLYCLGELIPFWWQPFAPGRISYRRVTADEVRRHRLLPVLTYAGTLAHLVGLDWFSTELCLSDDVPAGDHRVSDESGRQWSVVAIDHVNDQCQVDVQSRWPGAPPDDVVRHVAARFAEVAASRRKGAIPIPLAA